MRKALCQWLITAMLLLMVCGLGTASTPYPSYSFDAWGRRVVSPAPYEPIGLVRGSDILVEDPWSIDGYAVVPLNQPTGLAVDEFDHLWVADTGNNRVVQFDSEFNFVSVIGDSRGDGRLNRPRGVFVDRQGYVYVADTGNNRIAVFTRSGEFVRDYRRPDSPVFGADYRFAPISVVVDHRGSLFVATEGGYRGLVNLSSEGKFLGFFGGNAAGFDLLWVLKQLFFTEEQLRQEARRLPTSPSSVAVDTKGMIYTTTTATNSGQIKRFNLGGTNTLPVKDYGDRYARSGVSVFSAIAVDGRGFITAVDANTGQIFQYGPSGDILFVFGGKSAALIERMGIINQAAGLAVRSDGTLLVSDSRANNVHVFEPTEFTRLVHQAVYLYEDGRYEESHEYWQEVLRLNANYDLAHRGLGMAAYQREDWDTAIEHFTIANDPDGYSDAFWWARRAWLLKHFSTVLVVLVVLWVGGALVHRVWRSKHPRRARRDWSQIHWFLGDLQHIKTMLRHPIDGYYAIRWEGKGSLAFAWFLVILAFATRIFSLFFTSPVFMHIDRTRINLVEQALIFLLPFFIWVLSNYLISSLYSGEGRLRDIFIGSAYALVPYIIITLPLTVMSNGLTHYEGSVYTFFQYAAWIWSFILFYLMVQTVHNYDVWEAVPNCILSLFTMVMTGAIGGLVIALTYNVSEFVVALYKEVIFRVL
ncbi:MAG: hypothetical protein GX205_09365 [Firmicutes bacterium]|nr:hypothetical protein [Bacillota bacterium]